jgi:hypothetical protein
MIDPNEIAEALWSQSTDRKLYATWADVPANVKEVWRGSYDAFAGALNRAGYTVTSISALDQFRAQARREEVAEVSPEELLHAHSWTYTIHPDRLCGIEWRRIAPTGKKEGGG